MSRALVCGAIALFALAAVLVLRSDSRGDGPAALKSATSKAAAAGPAAKPPAEAAGKQSARPVDKAVGKAAVEHALGEPAEFNFKDTPLKDVAAFVSDHFKINVLIDSKSLADAGVTPDTTFTEQIKGVTLRSALRRTLATKELDFIEGEEGDDNLLTITTSEVAKTHTSTQIYDVRNLADPVVEFSPGPVAWTRLAEIITSTVSRASWNANGGAGSMSFIEGNMVVMQTGEIHEQIADLLSLLEMARQIAARPKGAEPPVTIRPPDAPVSRIEQVLDSRQDFVFNDTPLGDVARAVEKKLGVPVQLDTKALSDAGVTPETPMSISLKQIRARVGLRELLKPKDLAFLVDHDVLLITTAEIAKSKTIVRLYPIEDLIGPVNPTTGEPDFQSIVETITDTVVPAAWDANGGAGSIEAFRICKVLVISQTMEIHDEIKKLLTRLRAARKSNPPAAAAVSNAPVVRMYSLRQLADEKENQQIVDMICKLVEPKSWSDSNAYIGLVAGSIVVRQTPEVHAHIQNLLNALSLTPSLGTSATGANPTGINAGPGTNGGGGFGGAF